MHGTCRGSVIKHRWKASGSPWRGVRLSGEERYGLDIQAPSREIPVISIDSHSIASDWPVQNDSAYLLLVAVTCIACIHVIFFPIYSSNCIGVKEERGRHF